MIIISPKTENVKCTLDFVFRQMSSCNSRLEYLVLMSMSTQLIKKFNTELYRLIKVNDSKQKNNFEFGEMFSCNFQSALEVRKPCVKGTIVCDRTYSTKKRIELVCTKFY